MPHGIQLNNHTINFIASWKSILRVFCNYQYKDKDAAAQLVKLWNLIINYKKPKYIKIEFLYKSINRYIWHPDCLYLS